MVHRDNHQLGEASLQSLVPAQCFMSSLTFSIYDCGSYSILISYDVGKVHRLGWM